MSGKVKLIIGANGYIGRQLTNKYYSKKISFIAADKMIDKKKNFHKLDLRNTRATKLFFKNLKKKLSEVILLGTHSAIAYRDNFNLSFFEDFRSLVNLIDELKKKNNPKLIYFSSSYVYSGMNSRFKKKVDEKDILKPSHNFGYAKLFFENYINRFYKNHIIFRLSSVFGKGKALYPNAIFNLAHDAKKKGDVVIWGKGKRKMQYIYMNDVIKYIFRSEKIIGTFNLSGKEYIELSKVGRIISKFYNSKLLFLKHKNEAETLPYMNNKKLIKLLGNHYSSFNKSLVHYMKFIKNEYKG